MKNKKWTKNEDDILIENYPIYGLKYCLTKLDRSIRSIEERRKKLKIEAHYSVKNKYEKDYLIEIVKNSKTYKECLIKLDINNFGSSYNTLKKYIKKYDINIDHFIKYEFQIKNLNKKIDLSLILVENSNFNTTHLKERLYEDGLKKRKCEMCGQDENWKGKHISLILDHINGINNDHRLTNLRILCPNCNATLDTHGGKNKNKYKK
jgi:hypothetical protein